MLAVAAELEFHWLWDMAVARIWSSETDFRLYQTKPTLQGPT